MQRPENFSEPLQVAIERRGGILRRRRPRKGRAARRKDQDCR
jgi:hypothetical protein